MIKKNKTTPFLLLILDGWGLSANKKGNAIALAKTPFFDSLLKKYPYSKLDASEEAVGLPKGEPGNSEAGHMNIGSGRIVLQDMVKINKSIKDGTFFRNPGFQEAVRHVKKNNSRLHIMGLISSGNSPHSSLGHLQALLEMTRREKIEEVFLHLFTDGRDSPQYHSLKILSELKNGLKTNEKISTLIGRFYAMDRKREWSRTELAYNALILGRAEKAKNIEEAITKSYNRGESDEFIKPFIFGKKNSRIQDNDSIIFFNLRSDRARQLSKAFVQEKFNFLNPKAFKRQKVVKNLRFVAMTDFGPDLYPILTAYPSNDIKKTLPIILKDFSQLYVAEEEKHAHVTYFFNGGYDHKINGEDYQIIESPKVKIYDETPAMKSQELTKIVLNNLRKNKYQFTALNLAAPDMIGHTGNLEAAIICCQEVDKCLKKIVNAYLKKGGSLLITADHGNIEEMINLKTGEINTEHSTNKVPLIFVSKKIKIKSIKDGILADISPTILKLFGVKKPREMSGKNLIRL